MTQELFTFLLGSIFSLEVQQIQFQKTEYSILFKKGFCNKNRIYLASIRWENDDNRVNITDYIEIDQKELDILEKANSPLDFIYGYETDNTKPVMIS